MTTFDQRDKGFENKFAHDEEMTFKMHARRNKLLGMWAASRLGKSGQVAEEYARDVVLADVESSGHSDIVEKLLNDFTLANIAITAKEIQAEMERLLMIARQELLGDAI